MRRPGPAAVSGPGCSSDMEISVTQQAVQLCASLASGAALGLCYDLLRTMRRRCSKAAAQLLDLLFWLTAAAALFVFGMDIGLGQLRLFMIFGAGAGILLYFGALSPFVTRVFSAVANAFAQVLHICARPFVKVAEMLKKAGLFFKKLFPNPKRWFTIKNNDHRSKRKEPPGTEVLEDEAQTRKYIY